MIYNISYGQCLILRRVHTKRNILFFCGNRGDKLLRFYTKMAYKNIGFRAFPKLFRLRERGLRHRESRSRKTGKTSIDLLLIKTGLLCILYQCHLTFNAQSVKYFFRLTFRCPGRWSIMVPVSPKRSRSG